MSKKKQQWISFREDGIRYMECKVCQSEYVSCDEDIVAAIERYSVSGSLEEFSGIDCSCKKVWSAEIFNDNNLPISLGSGLDRRSFRTDTVRAP